MFGFLKPRAGLCCHVRSALNEHLCAACHGMAGFGGRPLALLTNYDATFWLVVASALCGAPSQAAPQACTLLPFRKVAVTAAPPRAVAVMAALNLLLLAAKLRDDVSDGEGFGRRAAGWALGPWTRRARRFLAREGFPVQAVDGLAEAQALVERRDSTLEALEAPTAGALAACFGYLGILCGGWRAEASRLGAALGRLLYLWDAVSDQEEDARRGRFNALTACAVEEASERLQAHLLAVKEALAALPLGERQALTDGVIGGLEREILGLPPIRATSDCCDCCSCCCSDQDACEACGCCCDLGECCQKCCPDNPCQRRRRSLLG